ncbi:hypothetical protein K474DRAFT_1655927 [Panus rudis PR-1116 ss-1]|nr:hypothetical protein K474DRAFT_1655927 [Panus rudis PR-1116 ss-1]
MITAQLRRNGLRGSIFTVGNSGLRNTAQHSKARLHLSTSNGSPYSVRLTAFVHTRNLSSNTPSPDKTPTDNATEQVPIPVALPSRKVKVDHRPGPVKPQKSSVSAAASPSAASSSKHVQQEASKDPQSLSGVIPKVPVTEVVEVAKHDYQDAAQHGILAPPPEGAGRIAILIHTAKEYFKFYWRGVKLINTNRKRVKQMHERVKAGGPALSRWESRFIQTYNQDIIKLIPFAIIVILLEEVIPLVVIYAPFLLPSTCILPSQKDRIDSKRRDQQRTYISLMGEDFERIQNLVSADPSISADALLSGPALLPITGALGLSTFGPPPIRLRRVKRHLERVREDDALLLKEGLGASLAEAELRDALEERGLLTDGLSSKQMQARLRWWLDEVSRSISSDAAADDQLKTRIVLVARGATGNF